MTNASKKPAHLPPTDLAAQLIDVARVQSTTHSDMLQALLIAYCAVAAAHECCREAGADALLRAARQLQSMPPPSMGTRSSAIH